MDVLTSETCWALNNEIIKQVTSSWSLFIQLAIWYIGFNLCSSFVNIPWCTCWCSAGCSQLYTHKYTRNWIIPRQRSQLKQKRHNTHERARAHTHTNTDTTSHRFWSPAHTGHFCTARHICWWLTELWYRPVEMWWHTCRNQISSFGETDESI